MKTKFVKTENVLRMVAALGELERRESMVPGLGLIHGHQGYGKTVATHWYAVQSAAVYVRAQGAWTVNWMLMDLAATLGLAPEGISRANFRNIVSELGKRPRLVMVDEADYVIRERKMLDTVRDLHDATGAPLVLVGMAGCKEAVARKSPQFWSRVSQEVEFVPLSVEDVRVIALDLADLQLQEDLARKIQRQTEGNFRKTVVLLNQIEVICKTNKSAPTGKVVEMAARGLKVA